MNHNVEIASCKISKTRPIPDIQGISNETIHRAVLPWMRQTPLSHVSPSRMMRNPGQAEDLQSRILQ